MDLPETFGCFDDDLRSQRLDAEQLLEAICVKFTVEPKCNLKENILGRLGFMGKKLNAKCLPSTNRSANHLSWKNFIQPMLPKEPVESIFMKEIRRDDHYIQYLVVSKIDVPEETHNEYQESFFILDGRCACTVGGTVFELSAGDYLDIPLDVPHDVRLLSEEVTAILQYKL